MSVSHSSAFSQDDDDEESDVTYEIPEVPLRGRRKPEPDQMSHSQTISQLSRHSHAQDNLSNPPRLTELDRW